jgi:hypothetical protein
MYQSRPVVPKALERLVLQEEHQRKSNGVKEFETHVQGKKRRMTRHKGNEQKRAATKRKHKQNENLRAKGKRSKQQVSGKEKDGVI